MASNGDAKAKVNGQDPRLIQFERLLTIMDTLRAECPWDKVQTIDTLRPLTIEETYELVDAIDRKDWSDLKKELGDVMLHLVFYAKIAQEEGYFTVAEVLEAQCEKLIFRHPHIYSDVVVDGEEDVKRNWEALKIKEGAKGVLAGVPKALPALVKAYRIQEKASKAGFDWEEPAQVLAKVEEEFQELREEVTLENNQVRIEEEFGDLMFALVNYARFIGVEPETALARANQKFITRFNHVEQRATVSGKQMGDHTLEELEVYWGEAKSLEAFQTKKP